MLRNAQLRWRDAQKAPRFTALLLLAGSREHGTPLTPYGQWPRAALLFRAPPRLRF